MSMQQDFNTYIIIHILISWGYMYMSTVPTCVFKTRITFNLLWRTVTYCLMPWLVTGRRSVPYGSSTCSAPSQRRTSVSGRSPSLICSWTMLPRVWERECRPWRRPGTSAGLSTNSTMNRLETIATANVFFSSRIIFNFYPGLPQIIKCQNICIMW